MLVDELARAIDPQIVPVRKQGDETLEVDLAKQMFVAVTGSLALERDRGAGEKNRVGCEGPVVLARARPPCTLGAVFRCIESTFSRRASAAAMSDLRQRCG